MREVSIDNVTIERHPHPVREAMAHGLAASAWDTMRENSIGAARLIRNDGSLSGNLDMGTPTEGAECKESSKCVAGNSTNEGFGNGSHPLLKAGILRHMIRELGEDHGLSPRELKQAFGRYLIRQNFEINRK